jgi:hypothetical protein
MIKWRRNDVPLAGPHVDIAESEEICLGSQVSFVTDTQITACVRENFALCRTEAAVCCRDSCNGHLLCPGECGPVVQRKLMEAAARLPGDCRHRITNCVTSASSIKIIKTEQVFHLPLRHVSLQHCFAIVSSWQVAHHCPRRVDSGHSCRSSRPKRGCHEEARCLVFAGFHH